MGVVHFYLNILGNANFPRFRVCSHAPPRLTPPRGLLYCSVSTFPKTLLVLVLEKCAPNLIKDGPFARTGDPLCPAAPSVIPLMVTHTNIYHNAPCELTTLCVSWKLSWGSPGPVPTCCCFPVFHLSLFVTRSYLYFIPYLYLKPDAQYNTFSYLLDKCVAV